MSDFIPIMVDAPAGTPMRGRNVVSQVVKVAADVLKARMGDLARTLSEAAASAPQDTPFEVTEVSFTIHVDANGEVSVMSLAKGAVTAGAGIQVTLRKRGTS
jgi:hypothetical protein